MAEIDFAYFNYEHGGARRAAGGIPDDMPGHYDYSGLVRVAGDGGRWPHILIMGEGDWYGYNGGKGAWGAAAAMRDAGGRCYVPLVCDLPREWGPFAPVIFADTQAIVIRRFYDPLLPDRAGRNRNLLVASLAGRTEVFRVRASHGDVFSGTMRLEDARTFTRLAQEEIPCLLAADWNCVPSGPMWADTAINEPRLWDQPWKRAHRIRWRHGPAQAGPHEPDTRALDYLIGYWHEGQRAGGIGFYDAAELAGDPTPTQTPAPDGRLRRAIDRILVNKPWAGALVPGSYQVHQLADPAHPDSDHLRVSVAIQA
jgi:endonuclease/exonuclease/phosphatase family metal-dependent hydrolase